MSCRYRQMLAYVLVLCSLPVRAGIPNFVERSLNKQVITEAGQTYTVGQGRYVHKMPRVVPEKTRCQRDRYMGDDNDRIYDCTRWK